MTSRTSHEHTVGSIMATPVVTVDVGSTLRSASEVLRREDVGTLVVFEGARVAGILSERDIVRALAQGADPDEATAGELMTQWPRYMTVGEPIENACRAMLAAGIRHLPVFDEGQLIGIVSIRDLTEVLLDRG